MGELGRGYYLGAGRGRHFSGRLRQDRFFCGYDGYGLGFWTFIRLRGCFRG